MLHVGLDLSRRRLDYIALAEDGTDVDVGAAPPDADGLRGLARRLARHGEPIAAVIESMTGARFVHDTLELHGWEVDVADAQKVRGLAPLATKTDRIDARVLAELSRLDLVPAIWLPDPEVRAERERARWRLFLVRQRVRLKQRSLDADGLGRAVPGLRPVRRPRSRAASAPRGPRALVFACPNRHRRSLPFERERGVMSRSSRPAQHAPAPDEKHQSPRDKSRARLRI